MAEYFTQYEKLPPDASTAEILDVGVNIACTNYYLAFKFPLIDNNGELNKATLNFLNDTLVQLAFVSDARARAEPAFDENRAEIAWVDVAASGLKRMARAMKSSKGIEESRLMIAGNSGLQRGIYEDMCEHRRPVGHFNAGDTYPENVARKAMVLDRQITTSMDKTKPYGVLPKLT